MKTPDILYPLFALALWTLLVLLLVPLARFKAAFRREVGPGDFRYGESPRVPPAVSLPNRNYMNLLEMPVLFYVIGLLIYVAGIASPLLINLAWGYVALRVVHSLIHLTYNNVIHRLIPFAASVVVLAVLWIVAGMHLSALA